jgi:asparagine synthase (glutamine-hydrolysing)
MCGIAGGVFWDDRDPRDPEAVISSMIAALGHRGPDGHGVAVCAAPGDGPGRVQVALGHTRLAILDLSDRGAQPMRDPGGRYVLTFNGEIYNFKALRAELERLGCAFRSATDTEVILHGYAVWGEGVLERLRGMFAFALWDAVERRLVIARDRLGIKPVYVFRGRSGLLFASEVRSLLASGLVPRELDRVSLAQFLGCQTVPAPRTLVSGVRLLPPGHVMRIDPSTGTVTESRYWDALDAAVPVLDTPSEARARVRALLAESTELHLTSDVPVGIFLSGGIDSSALVALTRAAATTPRTFSIVLPGSAHDEAPFAREVARRFATEHTEVTLDERALLAQLPEAIARVDHPSGDGFNTYAISRAVRAAGIKVALSGLGGDELFGGYPSFRRLERMAALGGAWRHAPAALRSGAAAAVRAFGGRSVTSEKAAAVLESDLSVAQAYAVLRQLFSPAQQRDLIGDRLVAERDELGDPYVTLIAEAAERHPAVDLMTLVSYAESRTYMHDVLLRDSDQMSMAHGLELRVPLLDHRLVEYVLGLPATVKAPGETPKRLLVESLGHDLPESCVDRPKQGFVLPFADWMRGGLRTFCDHHLGLQGLAAVEPFRAPAIDRLWRAFLDDTGETTWSRPWSLVALHAWMEQNGIA